MGTLFTRHITLVVLCLIVLANIELRSGQSPLQTRIDGAKPVDTLLVGAGIYDGNLRITKRITLIGVGAPVIRGDGTGSVITISADSCVIEGFIVEHSGTMLVNEDAGILVRSQHNRIVHNEIRDVLFGIYFFHADNNTTMNNSIRGRKYLGLGERGSGIHIWNSQYNIFIDNTITDARDGFYVQNAAHMLIERNEVFGVRYGLHYMYADSNVFLSNRFYDNVAGAAIMYSKGITMRHNTFVHNRGFASFGILFQDCHASVADSNTIGDNVVGLFFEASTDNLFRHNIIAQNDAGIEMFQNSTHNTFTENNFIDNITPLLLVGKQTETRWSLNGKGNYWNSYDGYDLDGDNIGDVPMKIQNVFHYLEGRNLNFRLYLYSPASQAIAAATNAFPVININQETDNYPLMTPVDLRSLHRNNNVQEKASTPRTYASIFVIGSTASLLLAAFVFLPLLRRESR